MLAILGSTRAGHARQDSARRGAGKVAGLAWVDEETCDRGVRVDTGRPPTVQHRLCSHLQNGLPSATTAGLQGRVDILNWLHCRGKYLCEK